MQYFLINFDFKYFYICHIILDEKYTNENTFKTQSIHIFYIKYYITQTKKLKPKLNKKNWKMSK